MNQSYRACIYFYLQVFRLRLLQNGIILPKLWMINIIFQGGTIDFKAYLYKFTSIYNYKCFIRHLRSQEQLNAT